ncbi:hypothetical protein M885DRAFT_610344 [Pelagophyceae sp. CCMP2097]|nr:hypothetical protein M885DRAFT_610344 [Pelagophyceae sp. CCMP2097]
MALLLVVLRLAVVGGFAVRAPSRTPIAVFGFREAQRELMDSGAQIELGGDALLEEAQAMGFFEANVAMRQPRGKAGIALKNCGRSIADVGAKFRNKGGIELAAYTLDEASVYCRGAAQALGQVGAPLAAPCDKLAETLALASRGLYANSPAMTSTALQTAGDDLDVLAAAMASVEEISATAPYLTRAADLLRQGAAALVSTAAAPAAKKTPWG